MLKNFLSHGLGQNTLNSRNEVIHKYGLTNVLGRSR
jgi:hypothetical protein